MKKNSMKFYSQFFSGHVDKGKALKKDSSISCLVKK